MSILQKILEEKRKEVAKAKSEHPIGEVKDSAAKVAASPGLFSDTLAKPQRIPAVIAEIKRGSPSKGMIRADLDPVLTAKSFMTNGAACLSVLTDKKFFAGSLEYLQKIKAELPKAPVLRKDFIIDPYQLWESRAAGADAILLIVSALTQDQLIRFYQEADEIGLSVLVEVHSESELDRYVELLKRVVSSNTGYISLPLLGVNNRDLTTFNVDIGVTERLAAKLPAKLKSAGIEKIQREIILVAESGLFTAQDVARLHHAGARAFLIGESLIATGDPGANLRALIDETII